MEQEKELQKVILTYENVLQKLPGKTRLAEHTIPTIDASPVRLPSYRIPQAYKAQVEREIQEMLSHDVIQPSSSEWAAHIVIIKKYDGTLRICVDYRRLNSKTRVEAYPIPRISKLIHQLGGVNYIFKLDG